MPAPGERSSPRYRATGLSAATRLDLAVTDTAYQLAAEGYAFPFGDVAILDHEVSYRNGPYVVTQNMGAFVEVPEFLDSQHKIAAPADAESYLERLQAYARALDGETARLRHDSAAGVMAPSFILDKTIQPARQRAGDPAGAVGHRHQPRPDARRVFRRTSAHWH